MKVLHAYIAELSSLASACVEWLDSQEIIGMLVESCIGISLVAQSMLYLSQRHEEVLFLSQSLVNDSWNLIRSCISFSTDNELLDILSVLNGSLEREIGRERGG